MIIGLVACPGCGFSCCSKCLKYKCNTGNKVVKKVCGRCYHRSKSMEKSSSSLDVDMTDANEEALAPIDIKKKLDSLENPAKPPIVMYTHTSHWDKFKSGLEPADQEIVDRLRKLKEEDKNIPLPSVDEIKRRLAILKDEDPDANGANNRINIHHVDTRTDEQKTDDLIQEYLAQLELSSATDPVSEIEKKLAELRGESKSLKHQSSSRKGSQGSDDDEAHVTKKIIAKAIAEAALEKKYEEDVDELEEMEVEATKSKDDNDEKPSCVMCEQTQDLESCLGCHGDLYCPVCFEDNHDDFEMKKHKRVPATKMSPD